MNTKHTPTSALVAVLESFTNDAGVAYVQPDTLDRVRDEVAHTDYLAARISELETALTFIAEGNERPGHPNSITKARMAEIARDVLAKEQA